MSSMPRRQHAPDYAWGAAPSAEPRVACAPPWYRRVLASARAFAARVLRG